MVHYFHIWQKFTIKERIFTMNIERKIKVKWTLRNVQRMHRWLKLTSDFKGWFEQNGKRRGYKILGRDNVMVFVFCG